MTTLQFIAAVIGHLAWPVTTLALFLFLRKPLLSHLPWLNRMRYKEFEIEFRREVHEAEQIVPRVTKELPADVQAAEDELESLADTSPRAALLEAWLGFETTAASSLREISQSPTPRSFHKLLEALLQTDLVTKEEAGILRDLRSLRNRAVHEYEAHISSTDAKRYGAVLRDLAEQVAARTWARMPKSC